MSIEEVELDRQVGAWFTDRSVGNLSHARPHRPDDLAAARAEVGRRTGTDPTRWHHMRQVHGADVGVVGPGTPRGAELRHVDALVTAEADRPLVVQVADCVPVLVAGPATVGAVHAGRRGVALGVIAAAVAAIGELGDPAARLAAAIGPAIGRCCYEVPSDLRDEVAAVAPAAFASTTWGTPSLDLPAAVEAQLSAAGVERVVRAGGCTLCDPDRRWFSHRADPGAGRQVGLVVRWGPASDEVAREVPG